MLGSLSSSLRALAIATAIPSLASLAASQGSLWVVDDDGGPGVDFQTLGAAIEAAQDGDVIVVREGEYLSSATPAIVGKSLVLTAQDGERVVLKSALGAGQLSVADLAADQHVTVRGLTLEFDLVSFHAAVLGNQGSVRFEDCAFHASEDAAALQMLDVQDTASLVLSRCELSWERSKRPVMLVQGSALSCYDTVVTAGSRNADLELTQDGGIAIQASSSRIFLSGGRLKGGDGEAGTGAFPLACDGADGGDALVAADCDVVLQGVVMSGGAPGAAGLSGCAAGAPGEPFALSGGTLAVLDGAPPRIDAKPTVVAGGALALTFADPGAEAFALVSTQPAFQPILPLGELLVASPTVLHFPGAVPAFGKTVFVPLGTLAGGVEAATFHVQGAFLDLADASVRLGNATAVTVLAASL